MWVLIEVNLVHLFLPEVINSGSNVLLLSDIHVFSQCSKNAECLLISSGYTCGFQTMIPYLRVLAEEMFHLAYSSRPVSVNFFWIFFIQSIRYGRMSCYVNWYFLDGFACCVLIHHLSQRSPQYPWRTEWVQSW